MSVTDTSSRRLRTLFYGMTHEHAPGKNLTLTLTAGETVRTMDFGVQTDRYADQLLDLASIVRGEKPNDQDYDRDLRTHEMTLEACGL